MAGIYIHIPFCKQRCSYCDFHFSTNTKGMKQMIDCISQELIEKQAFLAPYRLKSLYLGGGTPSLLSKSQFAQIFDALEKTYDTSHLEEVTIECNPDDISELWLQDLRQVTKVNRLSIGIQSFLEEDLIQMNRAHNTREALECIEMSISSGFDVMSIDLIFGLPWRKNLDYLRKNFDILSQWNIPHISCYQMTVEEKTQLSYQIRKNILKEHNDKTLIDSYLLVKQRLKALGYDHYEISNYAKPGFEAVHNTNYWKSQPYLGIGPSAHSFDGASRYWNIANNAQYCQRIEHQQTTWVKENLTLENKWNELIITGLRTKWGLSITRLKNEYPTFYNNQEKIFAELISKKLLYEKGDHLILTDKGEILTNQVSLDLIVSE